MRNTVKQIEVEINTYKKKAEESKAEDCLNDVIKYTAIQIGLMKALDIVKQANPNDAPRIEVNISESDLQNLQQG